MDQSDNVGVMWRWPWGALVVGAVLIWRVAAYLSPTSFVSIPAGLHLPHALLGLLFLVAGVWAWWRRPNQWTDIFLLYGIALGVHWGGAVGAPNDVLDVGLFWLYLSVTALGDAALLHLAIIYPRGGPIVLTWRIVLYAPAAIALLVAVVAPFIPRSAWAPLAGLVLLVANLLSLAGGIVFLVRMFTLDRATRQAAQLPLIVGSMFAGSLIALLGAGGVLPGVPEAWNLALGLIPITLAIGLVRSEVPDAGKA